MNRTVRFISFLVVAAAGAACSCSPSASNPPGEKAPADGPNLGPDLGPGGGAPGTGSSPSAGGLGAGVSGAGAGATESGGAAGAPGGATGEGGATSGGTTGAGGSSAGAGGTPVGEGGVPGTGGTPVGEGGVPGTGGTPGNTGGATTTPPPFSPVYRIPLRIHIALSTLTDADLRPILDELNVIWLSQAGICFEIEVTNDETNRTDGFDFRFTSGKIPGAPSANGLTVNAHDIWSVDRPRLAPAPNPVQNPAARTTAHELGHALNLDHENPPPSNDCAMPCYCATLGLDCDDFLMRSGHMGSFVSDPEVKIARARAAQKALEDTTPTTCGAPVFDR